MVQQYIHQRQHAVRPCCPFQVQGLRPNAVSLEELKMFSFVDDNIIANLTTKLPANPAAADGVVYSSDTRCSSLRTSQFYFLNILGD